ncbi:glycoside hydrolase family 16 protein [Frigidibacter sp. MR17.24]|uniref:glycoside hydrolase family 16 protein n=1 Tax=Frigidibacter sp. MR17.24 TaxID=3127345 RepID=UPI003012A988
MQGLAVGLPALALPGPGWVRVAAAQVAAETAFEPDTDPTEGRTISFEDPFLRIDHATWNAGPKAGTAEPGFYGRSAFARFGGEAGFNPYAIVEDPDCENGRALQLSAGYIGRKMDVPSYYGNDDPEYQWISGNLQTARSDGTVLKSWRHGYFETRMRFPAHPLTWPAFWFLNNRAILEPDSSIEIDVVEHKGFEPHIYGAYLHEWVPPGDHHEGAGVPTGPDMTQGYNRYGVLLVDDLCVVYFNRRVIRDMASGEPVIWRIGRAAEMAEKGDGFWPLLTLALRADYAYPDPLLPEHHVAHMRIDYFRVYS